MKAYQPAPIPVTLRRSMFRLAAVAFWLLTTVSLVSDYLGPDLHVNYPVIWGLAALGYAGGLVSWFLPWERFPVNSFLGVILSGTLLVSIAVLNTGGVQTHLLGLFMAPVIFAAAMLDLRTATVVGLVTIVGAAIPLTNGWNGPYGRAFLNLIAVIAICAYIQARVRRALEEESFSRRSEQEQNYLATISALAGALDAKDRYTEAHSRDTAALAVAVGRRLGLGKEDRQFLEYAALLHDIGKIGIPGYVLNKPGPLSNEEMAIMREHPVIGERILASVPGLAQVRPVVRAEHERWDGKGYPDGLTAEAIPLGARIIHVCDAFHAMATNRPYRPALPHDRVLAELRDNAGTQFDPRVVGALLQVIESKEVVLSSGNEGTNLAIAGRPGRWEQHLEAIQALSSRLARVTDPEEVCALIGQAVATLVVHDQCRILLLSDDGKSLVPRFVSEAGREEYAAATASNLAVAIGQGISGWVAETKQGVVVGDAERHPHARHIPGTSYIEESMVAVPVVFEEQLIGEIVVLKVGLNQYSSDHLRLLTILANQAAVSIAHARLIDELRTDPLSGLANRRTFEEQLKEQLSERTTPFTLVMLDVDHLKAINDSQGHAGGDAVIRRVAEVVRHSIRPGDVAGRWAGDEFLILMRGLEELPARAVTQEIRTALRIPNGIAGSVSVTMGTATFPVDGATEDDLLAAADVSMYRAKRQRAA
jgi:diguanylate cyclase (GGDEF)-like protein